MQAANDKRLNNQYFIEEDCNTDYYSPDIYDSTDSTDSTDNTDSPDSPDSLELEKRLDFSSDCSNKDGYFNSILLNRRELVYKPDEYFFQYSTDRLEKIIFNRLLYLIFHSFAEVGEIVTKDETYTKEFLIKNVIDITLNFLDQVFDDSPLKDIYNRYKTNRCIDDFLKEGQSKIKKGQCSFFRSITRDSTYQANKRDNILKLMDYAYMLNVLPSDYKNINRNFFYSILLGLHRVKLTRNYYVMLFTDLRKFINDIIPRLEEVNKISNDDTVQDIIYQLKDINNLISMYKNYLDLVVGCFVRQIGTFARRLCKHYKELNLSDLFSFFFIKLRFAIATFDANKGSITSYVLGVFRNTELMICAKQKADYNPVVLDMNDRFSDYVIHNNSNYNTSSIYKESKCLEDLLSEKLDTDLDYLLNLLQENSKCFPVLTELISRNKNK